MSHKPVYTGIIPARYNSTRFPGKPVYPIAGIPMVVRVYRNCKKSTLLDELFVATDDRRIYNTVLEYGGRAIMTKKSHASGTDRLKEASEKVRGDYFINIQGDEPLIKPGL
ncbi:MAG: cytidylyltransferase domain-containing protein, partial [Fibrobacterota bacterium]